MVFEVVLPCFSGVGLQVGGRAATEAGKMGDSGPDGPTCSSLPPSPSVSPAFGDNRRRSLLLSVFPTAATSLGRAHTQCLDGGGTRALLTRRRGYLG